MNPNKAAIDFCILLHHYLEPDDLHEVIMRNRAEKNEMVCHSHDFIDANEVMDEAWRKQGAALDPTNEDHSAAWDAAWYAAKAVEFDITKLGGEL